jgi:hypothetical protein
MDLHLRQLVWQRAESRCEYCQFPAQFAEAPLQIDHIIAQKHGGETSAENLALSCYYCNTYKGPNIAGIDPVRGEIVRLYHPRRDVWSEHFVWDGSLLVGRTAIGRTTIHVLWINHPQLVEIRRCLILAGEFPPAL